MTNARFRALIAALVLALAAVYFMTSAASAQTAVRLREAPEAAGPAVTLGDLFTGAGEMAGRAVAPAPRPGQTAQFSARFVAAAAAAAGLDWSPPEGLEEIAVRGRHAANRLARTGGEGSGAGATAGGELAIRRGDTVALVYVAPGLQLTARGRALHDAAAGAPVRVTNLQSGRTVEATATGPGAASVTVTAPRT